MKNITKHQCELSCSSRITCYPVYMYHLPEQIKLFSFTFLYFYYYACVDLLPEDILAWMPYYIHHK